MPKPAPSGFFCVFCTLLTSQSEINPTNHTFITPSGVDSHHTQWCNSPHRSSDSQREGVASIDWPRATQPTGVAVVRRTAQDCRNWGGNSIQVMPTRHEPATCRAAQQEPFQRMAKPEPCAQGCGFQGERHEPSTNRVQAALHTTTAAQHMQQVPDTGCVPLRHWPSAYG